MFDIVTLGWGSKVGSRIIHMNILITNIALDSRGGTETFVRDLALQLCALGHYPMVYSPRNGNIAHDIKNMGIPVVSNMRDVPCRPDIIHGHHHIPTINALLSFYEIPGIYVCHDRLSKHDTPPLHSRIYYYVAVDNNCRERLVNAGIPDERIKVIYNSVDIDRFLPRSPLPVHPKRALVFSNYASKSNYLRPIINACRKLNIKLDIIGASSNRPSNDPEKILGQYDLIFAKARCAMEAMATGSAVVLCDYSGLGPMVTANEIEMLRSWNFGMRCLKQPINEENIIRQIKRYNSADATIVCDYMRQKVTLSNMAAEYVNLYNETLHVVSDKRLDLLDEFNGYLNFLAAQTEKCGSVISLYKNKQLQFVIQFYLKRLLQLLPLLQDPKRLWKEITYRCKLDARIRIPRRGIIFESDSVYNPVLRNHIKNIDRMLIKISMAENMLLKFSKP